MLLLAWLCWPLAAAFVLHKYPIEDVAREYDCVVADQETFQGAVKSGPGNTLVLFYADHCAFSFAMISEWGKLCARYRSGTVGENQEPMKVLMVNAMKHDEVAKQETVYQFPEIRLYRSEADERKAPLVFVGERTATSIVRWVDHVVNSLENIRTAEEYHVLTESHLDAVVMILFIPPRLKDVEHDVVRLFRELSKREQDAYFAVTRDPAVASEIVTAWRVEREDDVAQRALEM